MYKQTSTLRQYALHQELTYATQGAWSMRDYLTLLQSLWHHQYSFGSLNSPTCASCIQWRWDTELLRTFDFLMTLLNRDPIPSLDDVIRLVHAKETWLRSLTPSHSSPFVEIVLATTTGTPASRTSLVQRPPKLLPGAISDFTLPIARSSFCCYYKWPGHMKEQCYRLQRCQ